MGRIVWTQLALKDLLEIFEFISKDSKRYAINIVGEIYQRAQILSTYPLSGKIVPELKNPHLREIIYRDYRIIYLTKSKSNVDILRIYHGARLLRRIEIGKKE